MVAVGVTITRTGKSFRRPRVALSTKHLKRMGQLIAAAIKARIVAGVDPSGRALPPDLSGDGRPLIESGALLASIKAARARGGSLTVAPDYKKAKHAIFMENGGGRKRPSLTPRRFLAMDDTTTQTVLEENRREVERWIGGLLGTGTGAALDGLPPAGATEGVLPVGVV
jgi:hypothetical protein